MRIIRTIFLLTAVVILMPTPPESPKSSAELIASADVSVPEIFIAATRTASDLGSFCLREARVCETAAYLAVVLEAKAKYSVRLIYDWANEASGDPSPRQANEADEIMTGSTRLAARQPESQNTLSLQDIIPAWRAPQTAPESQS